MDTTSNKPTMRERLATDYGWTPRQSQVLGMVVGGKTNQQIAEALAISLDGAKWHMREILSKLDAETREEAAEYWRRRNGLTPRFARLFRALTGAGVAGKWIAPALAGLTVVGIAAVAGVLALRGGDDSPTVSDTEPTSTAASPTTTTNLAAAEDQSFRWLFAAPSECPLMDQRPCSTAVALATALQSADFGRAKSLSLPIQIVCPSTPENLSASVCSSPRQPGDSVDAFGAGKAGGAAGLQTWDHTQAFLASSLKAAEQLSDGSPDVRVGGVGCLSAEPGADCAEFACLLIVRHPDADQVLQFAFRYVGEEPGFYGLVNNVPWEEAFRTGRPTFATFGISPDRYPVPKVSFVAWTPR